MGKVDLHLHSTASDGRFTPEEVVRKAAELGLTVIALSDHDTVDGIAPALLAAKNFPQLQVIPAIEISTETAEGEVHILGYFIDYTNRELTATLAQFRNSRQTRAQRMIDKLEKLGIHVDWQRVLEIAGAGSIGRPHIARAMLEKGYITSMQDAFTKYLGHGGPAYVERDKMTPAEAVELVLRHKGLPVLAHPFTVGNPEVLTAELKVAGLIGLEAYYKDYNAGQIKRLVNLAKKHNLLVTGGSDYHGLDDDTEVIMGGVKVPVNVVERLIALAEERALKLPAI